VKIEERPIDRWIVMDVDTGKTSEIVGALHNVQTIIRANGHKVEFINWAQGQILISGGGKHESNKTD